MSVSKKSSSEETPCLMDPKLEREMQLLQEREGVGQIPEKLLNDFGFIMNRLHDPCNYDHTTLEEMLSKYHFRDLAKSKLFRIAKKIFGDKMEPSFRIRTREFNLVGINQGKPGKLLALLLESNTLLVQRRSKYLHSDRIFI